jgi:hypothetical protein
MDETLARLEACLDALGVAVKVDSVETTPHRVHRAVVHLARGTSTRGYSLLYGQDVRFADVAKASTGNLPRLVFTTFVAPKTSETLRRAGTQHLDTAGNAWIEFGDVLIDIRGRPRPDVTAVRPRMTAGNMFSSGRAQVVFALLAWPQLWDASRRELAHAAGVSVGQAHNTLRLLAEAGYDRRHTRPRHADLLDLWAAAFPTGLAKRLTLATYRGELERVHKVNADDPMFLSGEHAISDVLRPATLTLYVERLDPHLAIKNRWRTEKTSNVVIRRKFWHAPPDTSADYDSPLAGLQTAPWPLVYADLAASDDPRVRTAAREWKDRFAGPEQHS